ncbi:MAG: restriction endonuclease subunit S [Candidatus Saccharimonadales bacterium]
MTTKSWDKIPLGEVLRKNEETIEIAPTDNYQQVTVRLWGKGVVPRGEVSGMELASGRRFRVSAGQFIMSRIDARHGAFGIVPEELDGAIATNDFPSFNIDQTRLSPGFLGWLSQTHKFVELCRAASEGTTNRVRLQEERFLRMLVSLPEKEEQDRIVAKLDVLAIKIEEARTLHDKMEGEVKLLPVAMVHRTDLSAAEKLRMGWREVQLGDVMGLVSDDVLVEASKEYPNFGIYSFGRGLFAKPAIPGLETSATKLCRVRSGQFIYSRLFAWEGAYGVVPTKYDSWFVSNEYPTFDCDTSQILPEVLFAYFQDEHVWTEVGAGSKGLGSRRQRVQPDKLLKHCMMLPTMEVQQKIKNVMNRSASMFSFSDEQTTVLKAMLSSILDKAFKGEL